MNNNKDKSQLGTKIEKYNYERYEGEYQSRLSRILSFMRFELKNRIWTNRSIRWSLYLVIFFWLLQMLFRVSLINYYYDMLDRMNGHLQRNFLEMFGIKLNVFSLTLDTFWSLFSTLPFALVFWTFVALTSSVSFYQDYENRTVEDYFSRITRSEYLISKYLIYFLTIFTPLIILLSLSYIWYASLLEVSSLSQENITMLLGLTIWIGILSFVLSSYGLFLSTFSNQTTSVIIFLITLFLSSNLTTALGRSEPILYIFNIFISLRTVLITIIGLDLSNYTVPWPNDLNLSVLMSFSSLLILSTLLVGAILIRILTKDP